MDIHRRTAAEVLGIPEDQVTREQRVAAREINFGFTYGSTGTGVPNREGMTHKAMRAEAMVAGYRAVYGGRSDFAAVRATHEAYRRFLASGGDPDPLVQLERRLWQDWTRHPPVRESFRSPVVVAALSDFEDP